MGLRNNNSSHCIGYIATLAAFILMMQVGILIGWLSPNIAQLTSEDSDIPLDEDQASWLIAISQLFGLLGAVISLPSTDFLGSRVTIIMAFIFVAISWVCMIIANNFFWLLVSRSVGGTIFTLSYSCFPLYLGEVADPSVRGTLITIAAGGSPFGIVVGSIAETYLTRKISSSIYLVFCLFAIVLLFWLKDSPYYLVKKSDIKGAKKSIAFYHGKSGEEKKLQEIEDFIKSHASFSFRDKIRDLNSPINRKSLLIIITLFALPHLSGTITVSSYMQIIMDKAGSHLIPSEQYVIYANIISVISMMLTFPLIDKLGRRFLLIVSSIGTAISMAGLGIHFFLLQQNVDSDTLQWLPVISILGYLITYSIGFSTVPSTVLSELFTDNVKTTAALMACMFSTLISFLTTKLYQPMADWAGETYIFWTFSVLSLLATPYALFILPETKGKTFQEIQNMLQTQIH